MSGITSVECRGVDIASEKSVPVTVYFEGIGGISGLVNAVACPFAKFKDVSYEDSKGKTKIDKDRLVCTFNDKESEKKCYHMYPKRK